MWWEKLATNVGKAGPVCVEYMEKQVLEILSMIVEKSTELSKGLPAKHIFVVGRKLLTFQRDDIIWPSREKGLCIQVCIS